MAYSILIVDDSATTRAIIRRTIGMAGVETSQIYEAPDGAKALELLRTNKVDLALLDINMPNMNGIELNASMKKDPRLASVPTVVISSESTDSRIEQLGAMGVRGYIRKPFTPEQIRSVITDILGESHAA